MVGSYLRLGSPSDSIELAENEARMKAHIDKKVRWRLLPILFIAALMCYLDRTNLSFAALEMNHDLGLTDTQYGVGAGVFFATYASFGIPCSIFVKRIGARLGLPFILVLWGLASGAMAFIQTTHDFYVLRLIVGATEAGFFPSVIYYLTLWFSEEDMGLSYTSVMTSTAVSGIVGGPLAGFIMTYFNGVLGLSGWRWLFIAEAAPTIVLGFVMLLYLDGSPKHARFLSPDEKAWLVGRQTAQESNRKSSHAVNGLWDALKLPWLWIIIAIWLLYSCGYYGIIFWMPLLISSLGKIPTLVVGLLSAIPYVAAGVSMMVVARSSDRTLERRLHLAIPALISAIGFFGAAAIHSFFGNLLELLLACLSIAAAGVWAMFGPYWAIPTAMLTGDTAAAGFALINSFGVLGGFLGPYVAGVVREMTGNYDVALIIFGTLMTLSGVLALCLRPNIGSNAESSNMLPTHVPLARRNGLSYVQEANNGYAPIVERNTANET